MGEPKKRTLAEIKGTVGYLDRDGIGYRKTRATAVLAMHSAVVSRLQDEALTKALGTLRGNNFDMERLKRRQLETLFERFDKRFTTKIVDEFVFVPSMGNIRDLGHATGHCDLCGKGDSRDDGGNVDKLRYQFLLTNTAGGQSVWVGSSCIVQHGLHVDGAANAEEAERILKKSLQEHMAAWRIERWREENPDHAGIPELWRSFSRLPHFRQYPDALYAAYGAQDAYVPLNRCRRAYRAFRSASRFYERKGFLSPSKTLAWRESATVWADVQKMFDLFRKALNTHPQQRVYPYDCSAAAAYVDSAVIAEREEVEARAAADARARRARRTPKAA